MSFKKLLWSDFPIRVRVRVDYSVRVPSLSSLRAFTFRTRLLSVQFISVVCLLGACLTVFCTGMPRVTEKIPLPAGGIGVRHHLTVHRYGSEFSNAGKVYIQSSLHADELPGLLVSHHLIKLLDAAAERGEIQKEIVIVPYANPIGLSQWLLGSQIGRFNLDSGINFNREWLDVTKAVAADVASQLSTEDAAHNIRVIRRALVAEADKIQDKTIECVLKRELFKIACDADVVLDLHCDCDAVMHVYTHTKLWPQLADLAAQLGSACQLIAPVGGGNPFDEAMSCPWADLAEQFPGFPIPMACESATVELRGERDVNDELALLDASNVFAFLQRRGFVSSAPLEPLPRLLREATPLTGVDMIKADRPGVVAWKVKSGDVVEAGQTLGEIVDIEDPDAPRTPVTSQTSGLVFGLRPHCLVRPGQIIIKVSGEDPLAWRTGKLLTSK